MSKELINIEDIPSFHVYKAFEEVSKKNIVAIKQHSEQTRKLLRDTEVKVDLLQRTIIEQNKKLEQLTKQLATVQQKLWQ